MWSHLSRLSSVLTSLSTNGGGEWYNTQSAQLSQQVGCSGGNSTVAGHGSSRSNYITRSLWLEAAAAQQQWHKLKTYAERMGPHYSGY